MWPSVGGGGPHPGDKRTRWAPGHTGRRSTAGIDSTTASGRTRSRRFGHDTLSSTFGGEPRYLWWCASAPNIARRRRVTRAERRSSQSRRRAITGRLIDRPASPCRARRSGRWSPRSSRSPGPHQRAGHRRGSGPSGRARPQPRTTVTRCWPPSSTSGISAPGPASGTPSSSAETTPRFTPRGFSTAIA